MYVTRPLSDVFYYPVKSLRGLRCEACTIDRRGISGDRRWMLVDTDGVFLTQRHLPLLARIDVTPVRNGLSFSMDGGPALYVATPSEDGPRRPCRVWNDHLHLLDAGDDAARFLTDQIGRRCRLVYQDDRATRPVDRRYRTSESDEVSLADGYPLLLTATASLDDLNRRLADPMPMDRFRPNLVVSTDLPYEEDSWRRFRIGNLDFVVAKPCARCAVTTVDQVSGDRSSEPLRTLATYRTRQGRVLFGQNVIPTGAGTLHRGDIIEVLETA